MSWPVSLLHPAGLWLLGALAPLIALYILKARRKRVAVSSILLWTAADRELTANRPFRRLLPQVPLLLEAMALLLFALALAEPSTRGRLSLGEHVVVVLDTSASMSAMDGTGAMRIELARRAADRVLAALDPGAESMIIEADREARIISPFDPDQRRQRAVVSAVSATDAEGTLDAAIALAVDRLRQVSGTRRLVVVTDGAAKASDEAKVLGQTHIPLQVLRVGGTVDNTAIVRSDVRAGIDPLTRRDQVQAFVLLHNFGARPRELYVTLREENASDVLASRRILVQPGESSPVVLTWNPERGDVGRGLLIDASPHDAMPADDVAYARVPSSAALAVAVVSTNAPGTAATGSWWERAFESDPEVALATFAAADLSSLSPTAYGLTVLDGLCPHPLPASDLLIVNPPPGPCAGRVIGPAVSRPTIASWARGDARMRFVTLSDVALDHVNLIEGAGASPLIGTREGAIAADASSPTRDVTLLSFDVAATDWPSKASFVIFTRNLTELARSRRAHGVALPTRVGESVTLSIPPGVESVSVEPPAGGPVELGVHAGVVVMPALRKAGLYHVSWKGEHPGTALFAANLGSERESDLGAKADAVLAPEGAGVGGDRIPDAPRQHRWALALLALAAIAADVWWLHRRRPHGGRQKPLFFAVLALAWVPAGIVVLQRAGVITDHYVRVGVPGATLVGALLVSAIAALTMGGERRARDDRVRARLAASLMLAAAFASAWTAAELQVGAPIDRMLVLAAVDRSRSIDLVPNAETRIRRDLLLAERGMRKDDLIATVVFGADAATEDPPRPRSDLPPPQRIALGRDGTDIGAAIRRALAEIPRETPARLVLVSDGVATRGNAVDAAAAAIAAEVPIDVIPLDQRAVPDVRVNALRMTDHSSEGETVELTIVTSSTRAAEVTVHVLVDGQLESKSRTTIAAGEDLVRLREVAPGPGLHRYDVEISALDPTADEAPDDNTASAFVHVRGAASALVLEGDKGKETFLADALRRAAFRVDTGGATAVPADVAELSAYDLVVLSDIPAQDLAPSQMEAMAAYTRALGGGLVLLGGDRSMGPGGYAKTPIEDVSPVSFDIKQERRRASLAEVIAIDYSGSMGAAAGGTTKLALANEAAARSAALLGPGDRLGVEHVDTRVSWTVPLSPVTATEEIERKIRDVSLGGGGIYVDLALHEGYAALDKQATNLKHMLLFADGDDAEQLTGCRALVSAALRRGTTTSVVALGRGNDLGELEALSKLGSGRFYLVEDATRLPAVFAQETVLAARSAIHEVDFQAHEGAPSPVTRGIDLRTAPSLRGYVVTIAKPRATVLLSGPEGDPLLTTWQVGLGQAAAFTSDVKDRWGARWTHWPGAAELFGQLARQVARKPDNPRIRFRADTTGGTLHLSAEVLGDDGRSQSFRRLSVQVAGPDGFARQMPLAPTGAGAYAASLGLSRPGAYIATMQDELTGEAVGITGAVLPTGEELRPAGSDRELLKRLATMTGGHVRDNLAGIFDDRPPLRFAHRPLSPLLLIVCAFALLLAVAARRLATPALASRAVTGAQVWIEEQRAQRALRRADRPRARSASATGRGRSREEEPRPVATPAPEGSVASTAAPGPVPPTTAERPAATHGGATALDRRDTRPAAAKTRRMTTRGASSGERVATLATWGRSATRR